MAARRILIFLRYTARNGESNVSLFAQYNQLIVYANFITISAYHLEIIISTKTMVKISGDNNNFFREREKKTFATARSLRRGLATWKVNSVHDITRTPSFKPVLNVHNTTTLIIITVVTTIKIVTTTMTIGISITINKHYI